MRRFEFRGNGSLPDERTLRKAQRSAGSPLRLPSVLLWIVGGALVLYSVHSHSGSHESNPMPVDVCRWGPETLKSPRVIFPITKVGQRSTVCLSLCMCNDLCTACDPTRSGTVSLTKGVSSPFHAHEYRVEPYGSLDCDAGSPASLPAAPTALNARELLVFQVSFSPMNPGTYHDQLILNDVTYNLCGSSPTDSVSLDLHPAQGLHWSIHIGEAIAL